MDHVIELHGLNFGYDKTPLFSELHLQVPQNTVFGLLGPNGAGKTTLLKIITGLLAPRKGSVFVFGKTWQHDRKQILSQTGALIGQAALYGNLTAADNLLINARWFGLDERRIKTMQELTGLSFTGRKKVKHFSTGMKQRLGLAIALLHDPDLILLDEPLNGLDPVMRNELRDILTEVWKAGKTVLISSHELSEIEKTCTHVAALNNGQCVYQGPIHSLLEHQARTVYIRCTRPEILEKAAGLQGLGVHLDGSVTLPGDRQFALLIRQLVEEGVDILGVETKMSGLDHFFKKNAES